MHPRFFRRRPRYRYTTGAAEPDRRMRGITLLLFLAALSLFLTGAAVFLKDISCQIAVSDARDIVTVQVNEAIARIMAEGEYDEDSFVSFEKDAAGEITAISANMARINALSAEILHEVVDATENRTLRVSIPLGNLTGISLLMGRGPAVPVQIIMLTSSRVEFQNNIITTGINQTKHQIDLQVLVDIDILIPWGTESAQVVTEVMIADTVVVGKVPESYWSMQQ